MQGLTTGQAGEQLGLRVNIDISGQASLPRKSLHSGGISALILKHMHFSCILIMLDMMLFYYKVLQK